MMNVVHPGNNMVELNAISIKEQFSKFQNQESENNTQEQVS
jgi:hypothetical protein